MPARSLTSILKPGAGRVDRADDLVSRYALILDPGQRGQPQVDGGRAHRGPDSVIAIGYWHARSLDYLGGELPRFLEWLRLPGDLVFIFLGALPILLAVGLSYLSLWSERPQAGATRPVRAA